MLIVFWGGGFLPSVFRYYKRNSENPHYHIHVRYCGRIAYSNYICLQKL